MLTFRECCFVIIRNKNSRALDYAVSYAEAELHLVTSEEVHTQALYLLGNIRHWRGKEAKLVRESLKAITGTK